MTRLGAMVRGFNQGFGRGVAGFAGGGQAEQAGYDTAMARETKLAQALAQIRGYDANAERDTALAAETRAKTEALARRPSVFEEQAALAAGVDLPTLRAVRRSVATGQAPQIEMDGPATPEGGALMGTLDLPPEVKSRIGQALMRLAPLATNTGDLKVDDWAQALGAFRTQDLGDDVLAGRRSAGAVGASQAAIAGKPLFNSDASGAVLDLFGGKLATDNPMAGAAINLRNEQAAQARAGAAENYAQAARARAEINGAGQPKYDPERGVMVRPDGTATAVTLNGQPLPPKSKAGPMSATLQKELIEADDIAQSATGVIRSLQAARALNDKAYSGYAAKGRAVLASNVPFVPKDGANATIDVDNLMTGQALESLKVTFGAAPTEGERQILMDMQASVDKTPAQRAAIIDRAIAAAQRRALYATNKAKAIRDGKYLTDGFDPATGPADAPAPAAASGGFKYLGRE